MPKGRSRGSEPYGHVKTPVVRKPSSKDIHRAEASGRAEQGSGTGGRSGGSKSAGGNAKPTKLRVGRGVGRGSGTAGGGPKGSSR